MLLEYLYILTIMVQLLPFFIYQTSRKKWGVSMNYNKRNMGIF